MQQMRTILYLHGMGGGGDSRIPRLLREHFEGEPLTVVCRTYSFDPEVAAVDIAALYGQLNPDLIIGESLGSIHALRLTGVPHLLVSPALGGPANLVRMAPLMRFRLGRAWASHKWKVKKPGDRQDIIWDYRILRKYKAHWEAAKEAASSSGDYYFAFFGRRDHYRRSGVVSIRRWGRLFGEDSFAVYDGTHFMEEEYVEGLLVPKIRALLGLQTPQ